ncbi:MAG: hypothetical protein JSU70_02200 [Phycisphaerales bacterium]|nr:MAG: hypothetical protein JSU70_02200 [Phycisphaerales bacterium]
MQIRAFVIATALLFTTAGFCRADSDTEKKPVWANLDIQLYGYFKADGSYDSSRTTTGDYTVWVDSEAANPNDDEFNMTAKQSRFGIKVKGPDHGQMQTRGHLEFDFYGGGAPDNKAAPMMRHAYLEVNWPENGIGILAGQTWDVMGPLNPSTLNYTVLWNAGNLGYRRPQVRLTKNVKLKGDVDLKLQGALARNIGTDSAITGTDSGADAGFPIFQGRVGATVPLIADKPTVFGCSGHWGQEEYDTTAGGANKSFNTWSVNLDLTQPVNEWLNVQGELFTGENLGTYFGGIGQSLRAIKDANGVTINHGNEIAAMGGWVAANLGPWDNWSFTVGAGIDDVADGDVNVGDRTQNSCIFGNANYAINKNASVGVEVSHWRTLRRATGIAEAIRAQVSFIYKFF